jgi:hypothetical protein
MAQEQTPTDKPEYEGTGRVTGALGTSTVYAAIPAAVTVGLITSGVRKAEAAESEAAVEKIADKLVTRGKAGVFATAAAGVFGAYKGWKAASEGKEQFEKAQADAGALKEQNTQLAAQRDEAVGQLSYAAKVLQERAASANPSVSTSAMSAAGDHASHADKAHEPVRKPSSDLADKAQEPRKPTHAEHTEHADHHAQRADVAHAAHAPTSAEHMSHAERLSVKDPVRKPAASHAEHAEASKDHAAQQVHGV